MQEKILPVCQINLDALGLIACGNRATLVIKTLLFFWLDKNKTWFL